jgi:hypothetical protein
MAWCHGEKERLNVNGDSMEVWCVFSTTNMARTRFCRSQNNFLPIRGPPTLVFEIFFVFLITFEFFFSIRGLCGEKSNSAFWLKHHLMT